MAKVNWVKYKNFGGPRCKGGVEYNPPAPWGPWTKIMGVVARCEGNHDTVVMYDETGVTFGFLQWTFKSGRLQKLLESFKAIPSHDFEREGEGDWTLFEDVCCTDKDIQVFEPFGFMIHGGKFIEAKTCKALDPSVKKEQKRIVDICMGRTLYKTFPDQKNHAMKLAELFANMGAQFGVAEAQIQFAKAEFKRALTFKRPPLGDIGTIENLLVGIWDTPAPALFFNLWQNNPGAAYSLFKNVKKLYNPSDASDMWDADFKANDFFQEAWKRTCLSKFGNWGFGKPENKSPRVVRIKKAINEFYGLKLKLYK